MEEEVNTETALADVQHKFVSGNLREAQRSAEVCIHQLAASDPKLESFKYELARIYLYEGKVNEAETALRFEAFNSSNPDLFVKKNLLLALIENQLGKPGVADNLVHRTESLHPSQHLLSTLLGTKGSIALSRGKLDQAQQFFQSSLQLDKNTESQFHAGQILMNLGVVELHRQHFEEAQNFFQQAARVADTTGAGLIKGKALSNLSWIYCEAGDYRHSSIVAEEAIKLARSIGSAPDQIQLLINKGTCQARNGEKTEAKQAFEQALMLSKESSDSEKLFRSNLALAYLEIRSDPSTASLYINEASRLADQGQDRSDDLEPLLLRSILASQQNHIQTAELDLRNLAAQSKNLPSLQWEAENTLAGLYDKTKQKHLAEHWYQQAISTFHKQRLSLKSVELELPFLENGSDLYIGYMEHLIRAGRTGEALGLLDTSRAETLAEGLGTEAIKTRRAGDPRAVAAKLHATVLAYCLRPERSYLWAITGKEQRFYTLAGSGAILPLVARHNEAILAAKDLLSQKDASGRALYDALLAPAAALLPRNGGRVVLVADSALSRLNFETLIAPGNETTGQSPQYWVEDVSITNARSLRLLAAGAEPKHPMEAEPQPTPKMLLIGDPVYPKGEYAPLPNAGSEMAGIAGHFANEERVVASRQDASPAAYHASRPGRFRFLHFVAHATASELNPLDSAVILSSKDPGAGGTNKLYASEILKQPLSAELVTLSSCYSSGTRNYTGEGVVGLAWAFLRAGAHSVIGALWDVSDVSTPKLMDTMYTRLLAGDPPDAALRAAKLEMLHSDGVFRKPVYWGAFQLYAGR